MESQRRIRFNSAKIDFGVFSNMFCGWSSAPAATSRESNMQLLLFAHALGELLHVRLDKLIEIGDRGLGFLLAAGIAFLL